MHVMKITALSTSRAAILPVWQKNVCLEKLFEYSTTLIILLNNKKHVLNVVLFLLKIFNDFENE